MYFSAMAWPSIATSYFFLVLYRLSCSCLCHNPHRHKTWGKKLLLMPGRGCFHGCVSLINIQLCGCFYYGIERVGFGLWWRSCSIFYLEETGGSCPNKKNSGRRNAISIYIPVANSFTPERDEITLPRCQIPFQPRISRDRVLSGISPSWIRVFPAKIISEKSWKNSDANSRLHSIEIGKTSPGGRLRDDAIFRPFLPKMVVCPRVNLIERGCWFPYDDRNKANPDPSCECRNGEDDSVIIARK